MNNEFIAMNLVSSSLWFVAKVLNLAVWTNIIFVKTFFYITPSKIFLISGDFFIESSDSVERTKDRQMCEDRIHELLLQEVDEDNVNNESDVNSSLYSHWTLSLMSIEASSY